MAAKTFVSLLEENRETIISIMEMAIIHSFMPDCHSVYGIFLNEENGEIKMFHTEDEIDLILVDYTPLQLLYYVRSHAVRDGDFKKWLSDAGIDVPENESEKKLKQRYPQEMLQFWKENSGDSIHDIYYIEEVFAAIKRIYCS